METEKAQRNGVTNGAARSHRWQPRPALRDDLEHPLLDEQLVNLDRARSSERADDDAIPEKEPRSAGGSKSSGGERF